MPVPDFQTIMLTALEYLEDGKERTIREANEALFVRFNLTDEEWGEPLMRRSVARLATGSV
jgi:restriction endonuclease Mrr